MQGVSHRTAGYKACMNPLQLVQSLIVPQCKLMEAYHARYVAAATALGYRYVCLSHIVLHRRADWLRKWLGSARHDASVGDIGQISPEQPTVVAEGRSCELGWRNSNWRIQLPGACPVFHMTTRGSARLIPYKACERNIIQLHRRHIKHLPRLGRHGTYRSGDVSPREVHRR